MATRSSEYDPIPPRAPLAAEPTDLERVQTLFEEAAKDYLRTPWSWWTWGVLLPAAALLTRRVYAFGGPWMVVILWSVVILVGGFTEVALTLGGRKPRAGRLIGSWVLRAQGNLSLVAAALSALLLWQGLPEFLPALWLLLVGHSFYVIGRLAFGPLSTTGLLFQTGGTVSLLPLFDGLVVLAVCLFLGCAWVGVGVRRQREVYS